MQFTKNIQNATFWRKSTFFQKHISLHNFKGKMSSKSFFDQKKIKTQQKFHRWWDFFLKLILRPLGVEISLALKNEVKEESFGHYLHIWNAFRSRIKWVPGAFFKRWKKNPFVCFELFVEFKNWFSFLYRLFALEQSCQFHNCAQVWFFRWRSHGLLHFVPQNIVFQIEQAYHSFLL